MTLPRPSASTAARRAEISILSAVHGDHRQLPAFVRRSLIFLGWNRALTLIVTPLPLVIQAPRLFAGQISFGDVNQSLQRVPSAIHDSLSFFRSVYDSFAAYRATIIRLDGLLDRQRGGQGSAPADRRNPAPTARMELRDVEIREPGGQGADRRPSTCGWPRRSLLITGSSRIRARRRCCGLAQLWPCTPPAPCAARGYDVPCRRSPSALGDLRGAVLSGRGV